MIAAKQKNNIVPTGTDVRPKKKKDNFFNEFRRNKLTYLFTLPGIVWYLIFCYLPMFGIIIAFREYSPATGFFHGEWVGIKHVVDFCKSVYFTRTVTNTLTISVMTLFLSFPAPIILALLLNEIKSNGYKRVVQTVTYLPHFISTVIICGMITSFSMQNGLFNAVLGLFGVEARNWLQEPAAFKWIYVISGIWQGVGWGSIVYLAALTNIDPTLYEAASIDGAGRLRQAFSVTIPSIVPTIVTLFILRMGSFFGVGSEKILLLYNPTTYETADVISTYIYRKGLLQMNYSYSSAIGIFNSMINLILITTTNKISRKVSETSLW